MELTKEILEKKYREFIWMFLERTTHRLIWCLREISDKPRESYEEESREINTTTKVISVNNNLEELMKNQVLVKICDTLVFYDKIIASDIPVKESYISHSKIRGKKLESILSELNPSGIKLRAKIQQEWGGSNWEIEFYKDEDMNDLIFCKEIGRFKMKFIFSDKK